MATTPQPTGMTLLHLVSEIRARLDAGMAPRDIARELGPVLDAEVDLGALPGTVGILGEFLDGLVWSGVVLVLAAAMRRRRRRRRNLPAIPTDVRDLTTTPGGDPVPAKLPFTATLVLFSGEACHRCGSLSVTGHGAGARCLTCGSAP